MDTDKKIYFATKALIFKEGRFLVLHKSEEHGNEWDLPGGRMEFGETAEETLVREVNEETGLAVEPVKVIDTWNSVWDKFQITGIIYLCRLESGDVRLSPEHDRYDWICAGKDAVNQMHRAFKEKMINWNWEDLLQLQ